MVGITLNLYISLGTIDIFMMLNNPNHEHVKYPYLIRVVSVSFKKVSISSYKSKKTLVYSFLTNLQFLFIV